MQDGGLPGAVMDRVLVDRLGLAVGDTFRLGTQEFRLGAVLLREPDPAAGGFSLGPRTIVHDKGIWPGPACWSPERCMKPSIGLTCRRGPISRLLEAQAEAACRDSGMRWSDSRDGGAGGGAVRRPASGRFWCWSGWRGWRWAGSASRRRCGPIWTARSAPSPR